MRTAAESGVIPLIVTSSGAGVGADTVSVDALNPDEVWILEKGEDGFATISRASDDESVKAMAEDGLPLGGLWYSDYIDRR